MKISKPDKTVLQINGKGLGHRLGMSQWGAKSLADDGRNYKQILQHYYSDVSINPFIKEIIKCYSVILITIFRKS